MATSIAVQSSGDLTENHGSVYDIVTERFLAEPEKGEVPCANRGVFCRQ
jgi:hypothetical protein